MSRAARASMDAPRSLSGAPERGRDRLAAKVADARGAASAAAATGGLASVFASPEGSSTYYPNPPKRFQAPGARTAPAIGDVAGRRSTAARPGRRYGAAADALGGGETGATNRQLYDELGDVPPGPLRSLMEAPGRRKPAPPSASPSRAAARAHARRSSVQSARSGGGKGLMPPTSPVTTRQPRQPPPTPFSAAATVLDAAWAAPRPLAAASAAAAPATPAGGAAQGPWSLASVSLNPAAGQRRRADAAAKVASAARRTATAARPQQTAAARAKAAPAAQMAPPVPGGASVAMESIALGDTDEDDDAAPMPSSPEERRQMEDALRAAAAAPAASGAGAGGADPDAGLLEARLAALRRRETAVAAERQRLEEQLQRHKAALAAGAPPPATAQAAQGPRGHPLALAQAPPGTAGRTAAAAGASSRARARGGRVRGESARGARGGGARGGSSEDDSDGSANSNSSSERFRKQIRKLLKKRPDGRGSGSGAGGKGSGLRAVGSHARHSQRQISAARALTKVRGHLDYLDLARTPFKQLAKEAQTLTAEDAHFLFGLEPFTLETDTTLMGKRQLDKGVQKQTLGRLLTLDVADHDSREQLINGLVNMAFQQATVETEADVERAKTALEALLSLTSVALSGTASGEDDIRADLRDAALQARERLRNVAWQSASVHGAVGCIVDAVVAVYTADGPHEIPLPPGHEAARGDDQVGEELGEQLCDWTTSTYMRLLYRVCRNADSLAWTLRHEAATAEPSDAAAGPRAGGGASGGTTTPATSSSSAKKRGSRAGGRGGAATATPAAATAKHGPARGAAGGSKRAQAAAEHGAHVVETALREAVADGATYGGSALKPYSCSPAEAGGLYKGANDAKVRMGAVFKLPVARQLAGLAAVCSLPVACDVLVAMGVRDADHSLARFAGFKHEASRSQLKDELARASQRSLAAPRE